jgi:hypothetical protein
MASTIQVDNIKDIGGNTIISSNGSGTFTSNLPASAPNVSTATGTLPIANGGTGATTLAAAGLTNTPNFKILLTSNQSISNGTETKISFNSTEFDTASGWNSSSYKYIIPSGQGGLWFISTNARMSGGGNNTMGAGDLNLYKNNDTVAHVGLTPNTSSAMGIFGAYIGGIFNVSAADEIYVKAYITAGGARVDGEARFTALQGFKLIGV